MKKIFFLRQHLHIFVLCAFAIAQPLFDLFSRYPEFFAARHSQPLDILLFIIAALVTVPLLLVLIEILIRLINQKVGKRVHGFFIICIVVVICLPLIKKIESLPAAGIFPLSAAAGAVFLAIYFRYDSNKLDNNKKVIAKRSKLSDSLVR